MSSNIDFAQRDADLEWFFFARLEEDEAAEARALDEEAAREACDSDARSLDPYACYGVSRNDF